MISGSTGVVGIIADPIAHVRTPQAFNALMAARGQDVAMLPFHVPATTLAPFMTGIRAARNLIGLVVTIPHKETILAHCARLTPSAQRVRAANVVRFDPATAQAIGTNTDGEGFLAGLRGQGREVAGRTVYLAGAGGAAKAIADALLEAGVRTLGIHNRTEARARELVDRLRGRYAGADIHLESAEPEDYALAINATSLGLQEGDPLPFSLERLAHGALVAEVIMKTEITPLLAAAQRRGHPVHPGRHMLDGQMQSIARFLGVLS